MDRLESAIQQLEAQRAAIDKALEALQAVSGAAPTATGNARSIAQRARWAKRGVKKKGGITAEG